MNCKERSTGFRSFHRHLTQASQVIIIKCFLRLWFLFALCSLVFSAQAAEQITTRGLLKILQGPDGPAGFCVQLGCDDGALTADLAKNGRFAVHALEAEEKKVQRARQRLQERGVYGQAAVEQWADNFLPYADNLINVLIAENPGKVDEAEMLRVLAPLGYLWVQRDGFWRSIQKPWPKEFDEWTHGRHGADGNMVSRDTAVELPTGLRWVAGPVQDSGGRKWYYDHVLVSSAGRNFYVYEEEIVARDGFNGRLLWSRPAKAYTFKETGVQLAGFKLGTRTSKVCPVALEHRLYAAIDGKLVALDAASGETARTFGKVSKPREIAIAEGSLLISDENSIRAFDLQGNLRWAWDEPARRMVAGNHRLYCLQGNDIICLDLANGKELWRVAHDRAAEAQTCAYYEGVLVLERSAWRDDAAGSGLVVFAGDTGKILWTKDYKPGMTHWKEARTFFADNLIWVEMETKKKGDKIKWAGLDPQSGNQQKELSTRGLHCSAPVATERFFIAAEMEFTDIKTGQQSRGRMVKSACRLPFIPANGLLYSFPVQCECFPMLRGYIGLAQTQPARESISPRLQRGPAFGRERTWESAHEEDWPMYRHDSYRSGSTPTVVPETNLKKLWQVQVAEPGEGLVASDWEHDPFVGGIITPPVCVSNFLIVAVPHSHRVVALDANTGAERWSYIAGGRVDTPPTIYQDLCLFGAHDGYVYCLSVTDGQLVWRFRAAPQETRIAVYGQMESPWPVPGSIFAVFPGVEPAQAKTNKQGGDSSSLAGEIAGQVVGSILSSVEFPVFFSAGWHPMSDGGVRLFAVSPRSGKVVWESGITNMGLTNWYSPMMPGGKVKVGVDYEPMDLLVIDGEKLAMSRWQIEPEDGTVKLAFTKTNYQAFGDLEVPRGLWGYGIRQNKPVLHKPPAVFNSEHLWKATTNDTALLLAGTTLLTGTGKGELKIAKETIFKFDGPLVHDGLIAARGRVYAATKEGRVYCLGAK